jgi:hypothetical protein
MPINPLQPPINYQSQFVDLNPAFQGLGQSFQNYGEIVAAQNKAQEANRIKQQFSDDLTQAQQLGTQSAINTLILKYPQFREAFGDVRKNIGEERIKNEFFDGFEISNALESNSPDVAKARLNDIIQAKKNSNEPAGIYQQAFDAIEAGDIKGAQSRINMGLAILDPDRYEKSVKAKIAPRKEIAQVDKAEAEAKTAQATATNAAEKSAADAALAKAQADRAKVEAQFASPLAQASLNLNAAQIKNITSEISTRTAKLNLDAQATQATVAEKLSSIQKNINEMPSDTRKLVNESAVLAATSKQSADQFNDLAKRLEAAGGNYGVASSASDFIKKVGGFQGGMTQLKQEYTRLRNTAAIKSLPPGPATDKDIQMALSGFPSDTARAGDLASFLRGMAKLQDIDAAVANAKTDWLANNNGVLTRAKNTFQAGDYATKPGESFNDFSQRVASDVSNRYSQPTQSQLVERIPTDRNPVQNDVRSQADAILRGGK